MVKMGLASVCLACLLVVGCGTETRPHSTSDSEDPRAYIDYSCSGAPPSFRMLDPYPRDEIPAEAWDELRAIQRSKVATSGSDDPKDWSVVARTEGEISFLSRSDNARRWFNVIVERKDQRWRFAGSGDCELTAVSEAGWGAATWSLRRDPQPNDRTLLVTAMETACSSGRKVPPGSFRPEIHYEKDRITIAMSVEPPEGRFFNCLGNPSTDLEIELSQPVGERTILDVGNYPPEQEHPRKPEGG